MFPRTTSPRRKGTTTRRRRSTHDAIVAWLLHPLVASSVIAILFVVWVTMAWYAHASLMITSTRTRTGLPKAPPPPPDPDPYFGWQPRIADTMACSWRECFREGHTCTSCRDAPSELGNAPPVVPADWIPPVTLLARMRRAGRDAAGHPWPPPLVTTDNRELCEPMGPQGGKQDSNLELLRAVPIVAASSSFDDPNGKAARPKIMCLLYTMESAHATTIRAIRETWASHCDGFLAFSTASDPRIPAISIPHDGPEHYNNMWQKVRSIWHFVGTHYAADFDWFFQGGDDLFVLPQNLRNYLSNLDANEMHFVGRRFKAQGDDNYFNSGGAGYALSRALLQRYVQPDVFNHTDCAPTRQTSMEDVMIAQCFRRVLGVGLTDTRDAAGRERFHPFAPGTHLYWKPPPKDDGNNKR